MKKLFIVRHAKSSWDIGVLNDIDRTLNERGHQNAPVMAKRLIDKKIFIDGFISSPANRAFTTATYFAKAYNKSENDILQTAALYHPNIEAMYCVVENIDDSLNSVAIFSHNPGITEFVNELTKTQVDNVPTCGVFAIEIDIESWKNFRKGRKSFLFFDYPKAAGVLSV